MNFKPHLAEMVMAGRKTVTRRATSCNPNSPWWEVSCSLEPGRDYAVCPGRGKNQIGRVRILSVRQETLGYTFGAFGNRHPERFLYAFAEAWREGFEDHIAFQLAWLKINKTYEVDTKVWRVEFEVAA